MIPAALFIVGAIFGSFLNVVAHRVPRGGSIVSPPSACPDCGARIRARDNVPILSYLALRGRCRDCGVRIPPRYLVVELLAGAVPVPLYARYGLGREFFVYWPFAEVLLVLSAIDLSHRILPDKITLPGIAAGLIVAPLAGILSFQSSLLGAAIGGGGLYLIALLGAAVFRKESMGGGDIKLGAMLGAFLGWQATIVMLFVSFLLGAVVGSALTARRDRGWDRAVPFGPFLAAGSFLTVLWGRDLLEWYLGRFG